MPNTANENVPFAPATARELCYQILLQHDESNEFATRLLERRLNEIPQIERGLATELVHGIIRRQRTLDTLIQRHVSRPRHRVENPLWRLLQLGAYQLIILDGVPNHAAVSETVNLARRIKQPRWTGFLNGVLRSLSRDSTGEDCNEAAADCVPLTAGRYRRLAQAVFANPAEDPSAYFANAFSFPNWIAERWTPRFESTELFQLGFWFNAPHGLSLRVNSLRTTRDDVIAALREAGVTADPGTQSESIRIQQSAGIPSLPRFADGDFTVQDESAMAVGRLLNPAPGSSVLDLCAAPGTKSTHLGEIMNDAGAIVAADISPDRLARVTENAERLGLTIVQPTHISAEMTDIPDGPFDAALVDAPCSNTGVLGKRPEARWRISPDEIDELAALQLRLLHAAADRLKPEGRLVYSTCSIEPEENAGVIAAFLEARTDFRHESQLAFTPGQPADGGFAVLLIRES